MFCPRFFFKEARMAVADVGSVKFPIPAGRAAEAAAAEGPVGHEADTELLKRGKHEILGFAHPK